ncbi:sugar phosphate isomerase/epimerase [Burkholderia sp. FERM BP-3421]|uniref:sugar phosphate isomerase/epimerase family protein n=1 Tax=Burkholderia sp. FERM BP-3421 TaxID=1494466 RepID=UPI0023612B94|nr:TIM barrel protein [Burkholderia sp. FERM BP-3421]WDD92710.1 sugar phosphate isomerase/epimerase [Burkholderia sp. FERM BP-3421]
MGKNIDFIYWPASTRNGGIREHIAAASAGGFTSMAIAADTYFDARAAGLSVRDMKALAGDAGIEIRHFDTVTDWAPVRFPEFLTGQLKRRFDVALDTCLEICEAFELKTILAFPGFKAGEVDEAILVERFARLCDRVAPMDILVQLEFSPIFGLRDIAQAYAIVAAANRGNASLLLDTWHFLKGNPDFDLLEKIPAQLLRGVQVADGLTHFKGGDLFDETINNRKFVGEGDLPLKKVLSILKARGALDMVGPEVFSADADVLSPEAAGRRDGVTTKRLCLALGIAL